MKNLLILLSAIALTFTLATAETNSEGAKCSGDKKEMKCGEGKCGDAKKKMKESADAKKDMKCAAGKCGTTPKKAPTKAKCGQGKCG